nr:MAG TPA: Two component regulator propeller [Caudoviricetes sp.]
MFFQSDNGNIYVATRDTDTPEPVGNPNTFTYGCVEEDSKCALFKRIMRFTISAYMV